MPIEFPCPQCNSLLRTPDSSVGKKAKCPKCGAIADVPVPPSDPAETLPPEGPAEDPFGMAGSVPGPGHSAGAEPANPFAETSGSPFSAQKPTDAENPYATPTMPADVHPASAPAHERLTHTEIDFSQTLRAAWRVYMDNLGLLLLIALTLIGLVVVAYAIGIGIFLGFFFSMNGNFDPAMLMVAIPVILVLAVVALVVYSWIDAGLALVAVGLCRGAPVQFGDMFSGGRYTLQMVILNILLGVINVVISFACGLTGQALASAVGEPPVALAGNLLAYVLNYVVAWLFLLLAKLFIVDRDLDVMQAISASIQYMRGNKLTAFVIHLVAGVASMAAFVFTCGIGWLFVVPFWMILTAMMYLLITGQPIARYAVQGRPHGQ